MSRPENPTPNPYPPFVTTADEKRRWDACAEAADAMFADLEPAQRREQAWSAARVLYNSDIPTGDPVKTTGV